MTGNFYWVMWIPIILLFFMFASDPIGCGLLIFIIWLFYYFLEMIGYFPKEETVEPYPERCKQITLAGDRCKHNRSRDSEKGYCAFHENKSR